jgi:hypothetical protein
MDLIENNLIDPLAHWYYQHKYREILYCIRKYKSEFRIVSDVGAGSAVFSRQLSIDFPEVIFNLIDTNYSNKQLSQSLPRIKYVRQIQPADVFLLNDVLEHIELSKEFFKDVCGYGKNGDLIVITVPASMRLWSGHDVFLKHYRRYSKKSLLHDLEGSPISIIKIKYLYQTLFIPTMVYRKFFGKKVQSQLSENNLLVSFILKLFLLVEQKSKLKLPFGISLLLVARINK